MLDPKEKAQELLEKYHRAMYSTHDYNATTVEYINRARECALIAVQELIDCTHESILVQKAILTGNIDKYCSEYWEAVKEEIQLL